MKKLALLFLLFGLAPSTQAMMLKSSFSVSKCYKMPNGYMNCDQVMAPNSFVEVNLDGYGNWTLPTPISYSVDGRDFQGTIRAKLMINGNKVCFEYSVMSMQTQEGGQKTFCGHPEMPGNWVSTPTEVSGIFSYFATFYYFGVAK